MEDIESAVPVGMSSSEDERPVKRKEKKAKESKKRSRKNSSSADEGVADRNPVASDDEERPVKRKEKKAKESKKRPRKDSSSSDEGVVDRNPVKKAGTASASVTRIKNADGEEMLELGNLRYVTVRGYKGKCLVDIREFYKDKASGETKPGKKGISLSRQQFETLKSLMPEIEAKMT